MIGPTIIIDRIAVLRTTMRPIVTDRVAWSVDLSAGLSKTANPIEMPFGLWTQVGPRNHVLDWGPCEGAILEGQRGGPL